MAWDPQASTAALNAAGYVDNAAGQAAFQAAGGGGGTPMATYANINAYNAQTQRANQAAQATYQQSMAANEGERIALEKAKFAWQQEMDKAGLTGMYQGQYTMPVQQWQAEQFGTWGAPSAGQQTLGAQQQAYLQAYQNAMAYGQYYAPGTAPTQGQQTLLAQNQQWNQQLQALQEARAAQTAQQQTAQSYLNLLGQLRGPADWAKYQQVLGATPQGMRDLTAAAMGQYIPGGGATTGQQPQAANLQTLQQQVAGNGGGAGAQPGSQDNPLGQLPLPNQIAAQSWKNLAPSQQQMLLGAYESQGWDKNDVQALMNQGLPRYASNAAGAGTWRLQ